MSTIAYDLPVLDLIDELSATGHVTHTQHRKTKVTIHHNGGRLSHGGVLSVWQTRPASAHFNIDGPGTCAQFVKVNEYAWATGSTPGNQQSISIEMCNETVGPEWRVGEATWRNAARLAGWLFARVIGERPNSSNLVPHGYWSATACPGPYINGNWGTFLSVAQQWYDRFINGGGNEMELTDRMKNNFGTNPTVEQVFAAIDYRTWAIETKVDAIGNAVAALADKVDDVEVSPEQLQVLRTDIASMRDQLRADLDAKFDESFANVQLDADLGEDDLAKLRDMVRSMTQSLMWVATPRPNTSL